MVQRQIINSFLCFSVALFAAGEANAQDFPSAPIEMVVPYSSGGTTDAMARLVGKRVSEILQVPVVVINKPGAGGAIGTSYALSHSDGYRVFTAGNSNLGTLLAGKAKAPYTLDDVAGLARAAMLPFMIVTKKGRFDSLASLVKESHERPEALTFSSWGAESSGHFYGEILAQATSSKFLHIPYDGAGKAVLAVAGGHVDFIAGAVPTVSEQIRSGVLTALAYTGEERHPDFPDIPTVKELGYAAATYSSFEGFATSAKTSSEHLQVLMRAFREAIADPEIQDSLRKLGLGAGYLDGIEYDRFLRRNLESLRQIAVKTGIKE